MTGFHVSARIRLFSALLGLALVAGFAGMALAGTAGPVSAESKGHNVKITFTKWVGNTYPGGANDGLGFVGGDVVGGLSFKSIGTPIGEGPIAHIEATYVINAGDHSFTALLEGFRNAQTGKRLLNGIITEGWLVGAQVNVEFLVLTNCAGAPAGPCFQGTIRIMPASAD